MEKNSNNNMYDCVVIGGGASGMMSALVASQNERTLVIEHNNELGKKLKITGGGRCNILNVKYNIEQLLENYKSAKKYLYTPFSIFGVKESIDLFKNIGIDIKIENKDRAFPSSERAIDVYNAINNVLLKNKVEIKLNTKLLSINVSNNVVNYIEVMNIKDKSITKIFAKRFIMSMGGYSHPETGSTGEGFEILKDINLKINSPTPSLCPLIVSNKWIHDSSGITINSIDLNIFIDDKKIKKIKNINMLCTHFGLSGPDIINLSPKIKDYLSEGELRFEINLFPNMNEKELDNYILNIFDKNKNKKLKNILSELGHGKIIENIILDNDVYLMNNNINNEILDREINDIKKEERKSLVKMLISVSANILSLADYDKAIISDGGVDISEINFKNFSSKKYNNLYITGDMLDISRPSGGYSLQLCWTTGYLAGRG